MGDSWEILGDDATLFPETLNYTLNLGYQENWEMLGEHTLSPKPGACTVIIYYSHSPDIQTYQKMPLLHVYIHLWPLRKNSPLEKPPAHSCMLLILISNTRGQESLILNCRNNGYQKRPFRLTEILP